MLRRTGSLTQMCTGEAANWGEGWFSPNLCAYRWYESKIPLSLRPWAQLLSYISTLYCLLAFFCPPVHLCPRATQGALWDRGSSLLWVTALQWDSIIIFFFFPTSYINRNIANKIMMITLRLWSPGELFWYGIFFSRKILEVSSFEIF